MIVILSATFVSRAQEFSGEDEEQFRLAMDYTDNGNANGAIEIYDQLLKKYPGSAKVQYELAYCHYVNQDFKRAAKILEKAEKGDDIAAMYALHGNCFDMMGKKGKAIAKYKEGIAKYPDSGLLYVELGIVYGKSNDLGSAVVSYVKGIGVDPYYLPNYYRASQLLFATEPVWGLIFGEIHELLQPNSKRSEELSMLMYHAYADNMKFKSDSTYHFYLTLTPRVSMTADGELDIPFELLYETLVSSRSEGLDTVREKGRLDMLSLVEDRKVFLTRCFADEANQKYLFPVFKYQQMVLEAGHWEAYNMWLFRKGDEEEFSSWLGANGAKFKAFVDWFNANHFDPIGTVESKTISPE